MMKSLVLRGAGAGAIGGLAAFVVARLTAEPLIGQAIDYEDARDDAADALARAAGQAPETVGPGTRPCPTAPARSTGSTSARATPDDPPSPRWEGRPGCRSSTSTRNASA